MVARFTCFLLILAASDPWGLADRPRRVEVVSSVEELMLAIGVSAASHESAVELSLRPTLRWSTYGKFAQYSLHVLPNSVDAQTVRAAHSQLSPKTIVWRSDAPKAKFSIEKTNLLCAYIDVAFSAAKKADEPGLNVLIPLSLVKEMLEKRPNQTPEPTPTAGTSAAEQPLVPAAVVAHL